MGNLTEIRTGSIVKVNGDPYLVTQNQFMRKDAGKPVMRTKLRNLITGNSLDKTFLAGESFEFADIERKKCQYLYSDESSAHFMDNENFEQFELDTKDLENVLKYLKDDTEVYVTLYEEKPIGVIPIDSIYSPITKVNFIVENQRVGERIDYDKLIMEIHTNGGYEPKDALYLSAKLLRDLYDKIIGFENEPEYIEEIDMDPELERLEKLLNTGINEMELSVRCSNCLAAAKIEKIGELVSKTENEMLKYRNFGKKSLEEINALLDSYKISLGMNVKEIQEKIKNARTKIVRKK